MKRALVTGGSGAIGSAICRRLAADGCHVYVHAHRHVKEAEDLVTRIGETGGAASSVVFDVTNRVQTAAALNDLLEDAAIQIVVNNAGIAEDAAMPGMTPEQWARVIDVSLNGFFNVTQPLLMPMIRTRWGRIISISSVSAIAGNRGQTNYAAAKAGLHGATRALALEVASRGITVNVVAPGIIAETPAEALFSKQDIDGMVPMKRAGRPSEVADLVGFLASEQAGYISGQIISISGAMV